jgi:hypothetical protein
VPDLTPEERRLRAQVAANARWAKPGARKRQGDAITGTKLAYFERQIDPDGRLDPIERRQCAEAALRAEMSRLALRSAKARRKARHGGEVAA